MNKIRNLSIRLKLFLVYSALFLALMIFSVTLFTSVISRRLQDSVQNELESTTSSIIQLISDYASYTVHSHLETLVESRLSVLSVLDTFEKQGVLLPGEAKEMAADELLSTSIGEEGYFYVLDEEGSILIHPYENLIGTNVAEYDFVQKQLQSPTGYLEYVWKNPGEEKSRNKALFTGYYEPWGWIITASVYRSDLESLIHLEDLNNTIQNIPVALNGYPMIFNLDGDILVHPTLAGENFNEKAVTDGWDNNFFETMIREKQGSIRYEWPAPEGGDLKDKVAFFSYIPEYNWIIASTVYTDRYQAAVRNFFLFLFGVLISTTLLFLFTSQKLAVMITAPLHLLVDFIEEARARGNDLAMRFEFNGSDEIARLAFQFNGFLDDLQKSEEEREKTENRNRILAQFPEGSPFPVIRVGEDGSVLYANPAASIQLLNWNPYDPDRIPDDLAGMISNLVTPFGVFEYIRGEDAYEVLTTYFSSQKAYYLFFSDIRERLEAQSQMLLSESVFSNSMDGILITDTDAVIQRVNPAYLDISGYTAEDLLGKTPSIMQSGEYNEEFYADFWESLKEKGRWSGEIRDKRKNGDIIPLLLSINSIFNERGELTHYVGVIKDISELKKSEKKLKYLAFYDGLTGLPNRSLFLDRMNQAIAFADRNSTKIAVMFLDLDNFKNINDSVGHNVGDQYLREISDRLRQGCRDEDTIARLGGDEFLVMMPGVGTKKLASEVIRRFQKALHEPLHISGLDVHTTASMGVTFYPDDGTDALQLLQNADMAMYQSKRKGKDSYTYYESGMNKDILFKVELDGKMRNALVLDEFQVVYQPKVEVADGSVKGAEALVRWNSSDGTTISPADFIPLAEDNGFILQLGDWILEKVLEDLSDMKAVRGEDFQIAVNLSGRQFRDRDLLRRISRIVEKSDHSFESINFEITESVAMEDSQATLTVLEDLRKLNVSISIDDFGTGYSSLSYLKRFETDYLKIDKSFIDELPDDRKGSALVQDIIRMAHNLDMKIVAEGVEDERQLEFLKTTGCDSIQGYYFSRPLGLKEFLLYLKNHSSGILDNQGS